jgi:hypothetical protein
MRLQQFVFMRKAMNKDNHHGDTVASGGRAD